ncbi:META domain-containing protein [Sphingobacterium sp. SGG-5]|uniref:META domain-containing protein n=1 Tax=Sphingobacterium sp. SGG-5 TaxID=2710881 RepID=UPI0013ED7731|nr:META domain-containing protein [Sphingobacterium sp. SGG-5]NGM61381.1 META domain-containing protein [Sphingobacterium sp. SGG-5]
MRKILFIITLATFTAACNSNTSKTSSGASATDTVEQKNDTTLVADLYGKEWNLVELNGGPVVLDSTFSKKPLLVFDKENRVSGNMGCNGFGGNVELKGTDGITFSHITATQMACPNLKVEQDFLDVMNNAKSFTKESNTLLLKNEKGEITAKLTIDK